MLKISISAWTASNLNRLLVFRTGKQVVLVHFLRTLRRILWWEVCITVLLVALMDRMSNASCSFSTLSDAWLYSVAGVGVRSKGVWRPDHLQGVPRDLMRDSNLNVILDVPLCPQTQEERRKVQAVGERPFWPRFLHVVLNATKFTLQHSSCTASM